MVDDLKLIALRLRRRWEARSERHAHSTHSAALKVVLRMRLGSGQARSLRNVAVPSGPVYQPFRNSM